LHIAAARSTFTETKIMKKIFLIASLGFAVMGGTACTHADLYKTVTVENLQPGVIVKVVGESGQDEYTFTQSGSKKMLDAGLYTIRLEVSGHEGCPLRLTGGEINLTVVGIAGADQQTGQSLSDTYTLSEQCE
jgi:hypothetical protein